MFTQNPQTAGVDQLGGTYLFDLRACNRALAFNRFFWDMIRPDHRARFIADEEASMSAAGLTDDQKALVRARDWLGIVQAGVNFFVLEKWARVLKLSNLQVYARMRGETLDEFMQTRNVPEAR